MKIEVVLNDELVERAMTARASHGPDRRWRYSFPGEEVVRVRTGEREATPFKGVAAPRWREYLTILTIFSRTTENYRKKEEIRTMSLPKTPAVLGN